MTTERAVSLGIVLISLLYLLYAAGIEHRTIGNLSQPGLTAKSVPLALGAALFVFATILTVKAFRTPAQVPDGEPATLLVMLAICLAIGYVLLLRPVGFVLMTTAFVYLLVHLSSAERITGRLLPGLLAGLVATGLLGAGLFWVNRMLTSGLSRYGREAANAFLTNRMVGATAALLLTGLVLLLLSLLLRRLPERLTPRHLPAALLTSLGTTMGLYLVFRQVFQVNLPLGLLAF